MEDFLTDIQSAHFWLSVVVVSLIVSILASYLRDLLDTSVGSIVSRAKARGESRAAYHAHLVEVVGAEPNKQFHLAAVEQRYRARSMGALVQCLFSAGLAFFCLAIGFPKWVSGVFLVLAAAMWVASRYEAGLADRIARILREVHPDLPA